MSNFNRSQQIEGQDFITVGKIVPSQEIRAGRMIAAGRLTITMTSKKSGEHISLEFVSKKKVGNQYKDSDFATASHVFVQTTGGDRIGTFYPSTTTKFYPRAPHTCKDARVWAAVQTLKAVGAGVTENAGFTLLEQSYCGKCSRPLEDPVSIERGLGPHCYGQHTGSVHQKNDKVEKAETSAAPVSAPVQQSLSVEPVSVERDPEDYTLVREVEPTTPAVPRTFEEMVSRIGSKPASDGLDAKGVPYGYGSFEKRNTELRARVKDQGKTPKLDALLGGAIPGESCLNTLPGTTWEDIFA